MTEEEYNRLPGIRNTALSYLAKSPAHYKAFVDGRIKQTEAMHMSTNMHVAILEPERFDQIWEVKLPYNDGKGSRERSRAQQERCDAEGIILVSDAEFEMYSGICNAIRKDKFVMGLLERAEIEKALTWTYRDKPCKVRLDANETNAFIADFKFVRDGDGQPTVFTRKAMYGYGYHRQMAWQTLGAEMNGIANDDTKKYLIVVEKAPPYAIAHIEVHPTIIQTGKLAYDELLDLYDQTVAQGLYPGYGYYLWQNQSITMSNDQLYPVENMNIEDIDINDLLRDFKF